MTTHKESWSDSYKDHWYVVGEARDIRGDRVLSAVLLGEWLAVYRDENGVAVAVRDRCLHRNARLSKGKVVKGQLVCPYHGWKYGPQGTLTAIPSEGPAFQAKPVRCVPSFATVEKQGYIYVRLSDARLPDARLPDARLPDARLPASPAAPGRAAPPDIPFLGNPGYRHIRLKHVFQSSVSNCAENFIDVPHTTYVHPTLFRYEAPPQRIEAEVETEGGAVHVRYLNETSNFGVFSSFLNRAKKTIFHEDHFYAPNLTHVEYRFGSRMHFNITSQSVPAGENETHVHTDLTYDYGIWNALAGPLVRLVVRWVAKKIIAQDVKIMREQNEVTQKYGAQFASTRADLQHVHIERIHATLKAGGDVGALRRKVSRVEFYL